MERQSGFTLVELVVVIVILGILAAYAIPKYMSIDKEARIAVVKGLGGSLSAASDIVYAMAVAKGALGASASLDVGTGDPVDILANGYPAPTATGIPKALTDVSGFTTDTSTPSVMKFKKTGSPDTTNPYISPSII